MVQSDAVPSLFYMGDTLKWKDIAFYTLILIFIFTGTKGWMILTYCERVDKKVSCTDVMHRLEIIFLCKAQLNVNLQKLFKYRYCIDQNCCIEGRTCSQMAYFVEQLRKRGAFTKSVGWSRLVGSIGFLDLVDMFSVLFVNAGCFWRLWAVIHVDDRAMEPFSCINCKPETSSNYDDSYDYHGVVHGERSDRKFGRTSF